MIFVQIPFLILVSVFTLYNLILAILAFFYKSNLNFDTKKLNRFAVIIPAHNEELIISQTLKSIFNIAYSDQYFDTYVIADNCTDKTSIIAANMGAQVLERSNNNLIGKGHALKWCFDFLLLSPKKYDAFFIMDADTIASKNLLQILNLYLNSGAKAIQCSDLVEQQKNSWSSEITRVGLLLYNFTKPLGKKVIKCSAGLRGNGMCFTTDVLDKNPWDAFSQTEDLEFALRLLMKDISIIFAPEAKVKAIMPANSSNAESQRARWEIGRFPILIKYSGKLFFNSIKKRSLKLFDAFIDLILPAFVNLFSFTLLMSLLNCFLFLISFEKNIFLLELWAFLLMFQIFYVFGGLYIAHADADAYKALLKAPKFIIWKFLLYFKLAKKGHTNLWIRTTRESKSETLMN